MNRRAQVHSIDAVRQFRGNLIGYEFDVRDTLSQVAIELRRAMEWIEDRQVNYWPSEVRRASDKMISARTDLERCQTAARPEDRLSCIIEKKALEKAKSRLRFCEQQVKVARKWRQVMRREAEELQTQLFKMNEWLDRDAKQAVARLERLAVALEQYAQVTEAPLPADSSPADSSPKPAGSSGNTPPDPATPQDGAP